MKRIGFRLLILALGGMMLGMFGGCSSSKQQLPKMKIGFTKCSGSESYEQYAKWIKSVDPDIEIVDLYTAGIGMLEYCSGVVFTGGPDVEPYRYGKAGDSSRCDIDLTRDNLEFKAIEKNKMFDLPILAICRGEQILNVAYGGSLIVDIPSDYKTNISHRCSDPANCMHEINIAPGSLLHQICGVTKGMVNSNHHQAVDELSEDFRVTARTNDSLIEAYEWIDQKANPSLIAVQWHPERLSKDNPLSLPLAKYFIAKARELYNKRVQQSMKESEEN